MILLTPMLTEHETEEKLMHKNGFRIKYAANLQDCVPNELGWNASQCDKDLIISIPQYRPILKLSNQFDINNSTAYEAILVPSSCLSEKLNSIFRTGAETITFVGLIVILEVPSTCLRKRLNGAFYLF